MVYEFDNLDPPRKFALATLCSPASLEFLTARKKFSPGIANKVGDEDYESSLDGNQGRFELVTPALISWVDVEGG